MKFTLDSIAQIHFAPAAAQRQSDSVPLRNKPQLIITNMKRLKALFLTVLLTAAAPPLLQAQITETHTFTPPTPRAVPDGNASGLAEVRNITSAINQIASVKVRLRVTGEFNGDLYGYLRHSSGFVVLLNRPGKTGANAAGYDDSGLDVTFAHGAANGDLHTYRSVTTPAAGQPLTGIWQPDGRAVDPALVTDASARTTTLTTFNTQAASGDWTLFLADLESGGAHQLVEWALEISGSTQPAIAWANPADIVYGTALGAAQLNAAVTYASTNVNGSFSYSPPAGTILNAGSGQTLSVTFTPADTASFLPVSRSVTLNVQQAPLTITATSFTKLFGEALPTFTVSYAGFVLGQGPANLTTLPTVTTTATAASPVGGYALVPGGAVGANYAFNYVNGTLTINKASTTGTIIASANPALPGVGVTFTMTVSPVAPGAGSPDGTVNFRIDGNIAGSGTLSGGVATFTISTLALGSHTVVAEYAGSGNFNGTSATLSPDLVINTPPVASADTIERYPTQGVKVRLSTLLGNDNDADGDTLNIIVAATSANGGTVTVNGDWVYYTPTGGFTAADSFTYTINDGRGGSAVGTVNVAIKVDVDPGQNLVITDLGGGSMRIRGSGIPGRTYRLQFTDTLSPAAWANLPGASVTADASGAFEFTDNSGSASRYYRSVFP